MCSVSIVMPRKVRQVVDPSTFEGAVGRPRRVHKATVELRVDSRLEPGSAHRRKSSR